MAEIRLDLEEADGGLPDICMCCGEEATVTKTKKMSWCPPWVGFLILVAWPVWLVVMLIMTKRATLQAPLCEQHKGHWFNRNLIVIGSLFLLGGLGALIFVLAVIIPPRGADDYGPFACLGAVLLFIVWIVILVVVQNTAIRPKEITDHEITLAGVSDAFVEAFEETRGERRSSRRRRRPQLDEDDDFDDEPRPRKKASGSDGIVDKKRRRIDEDDDNPPPPKKKRPPVDEDEDDNPPPPPKKKRPPVDEDE